MATSDKPSTSYYWSNISNFCHGSSCKTIEHPEAQDTLEGIVEWWLMERHIKFQTARVKETLSELVAKGLILEQKGLNSRIHYRINQSKYKEIQKLFKQKDW